MIKRSLNNTFYGYLLVIFVNSLFYLNENRMSEIISTSSLVKTRQINTHIFMYHTVYT